MAPETPLEDRKSLRKSQRLGRAQKQVRMYYSIQEDQRSQYRVTKKMTNYIKQFGIPEPLTQPPSTSQMESTLVKALSPDIQSQTMSDDAMDMDETTNESQIPVNPTTTKNKSGRLRNKRLLANSSDAIDLSERMNAIQIALNAKDKISTREESRKLRAVLAENWMHSNLIHLSFLTKEQMDDFAEGRVPASPTSDQRIAMAKRQLELAGASVAISEVQQITSNLGTTNTSLPFRNIPHSTTDNLGRTPSLSNPDGSMGSTFPSRGFDGQQDEQELLNEVIHSIKNVQLSSNDESKLVDAKHNGQNTTRRQSASTRLYGHSQVTNNQHRSVHTVDYKDIEAAPKTRPKPTSAYMQQATRVTELTALQEPQPLLIIVDLNGTLITPKSGRKETIAAVHQRPGLSSFLSHILDEDPAEPTHTKNLKLMIWTSAQPPTATRVFNNLFTASQRAQVLAVWSRDHFGLSKTQYASKTQVYKQLHRVWAHDGIQASHPHYASGGRWSQKNTVLIDDSAEKAASEPFNLILVPTLSSWRRDRERVQALRTAGVDVGTTHYQQRHAALDSTLDEHVKNDSSSVLLKVVRYLDDLRWYDDVSVYMQQLPFRADAQPPVPKQVGDNDNDNDTSAERPSDDGGVQL